MRKFRKIFENLKTFKIILTEVIKNLDKFMKVFGNIWLRFYKFEYMMHTVYPYLYKTIEIFEHF